MKRFVLVTSVVAAAAVVLVGMLAQASSLEPQSTISRSTASASAIPANAAGSELQSVHALGRLEPMGEILKVSATSGNEGSCLAELLVAEGDDVAKGQPLARLDTYERRLAAVKEATAKVSVAKAQLAKIRAGNRQGDIEAARAATELAEHEVAAKKKDLTRAEKLRDRHAISSVEIDDALLAYRHAVLELARLKAVLESIEEIRAVDVAVQQAEVELAQASLDLAQANLRATEVTAPQAGRILQIHSRIGERPGDRGILELGNVQRMQAVAEVFEGDLQRVSLGQSAVIRLEANGESIEGRVAELGHMVARKTVLTNDPVSDTDARVVEVRVDLDPAKLPLVSRLSNARVQIHFTSVGDSLPTVPSPEASPSNVPRTPTSITRAVE